MIDWRAGAANPALVGWIFREARKIPAETPLLECRGVWKFYGFTSALADVHLKVSPAESILLYGPNGAGKTTLLRVLASLLRPTEGDFHWRGKPLMGREEDYRRVMGFVSHDSFLYRDLTPRENLSFFGKLFGLAEGNRVGEELLDFFGLGGRADDPVRNLSRGLQQRVSLARALLHDPEILLLDEPFTGLDEGTVKLLIERLRAEKAKGKCILVATHSFERGAAVADRLLRLDAGRVVSDGPVSLQQGQPQPAVSP